jgi:hypothetical protein
MRPSQLCAILGVGAAALAGSGYPGAQAANVVLDEAVLLREETREMFFHGFDNYMEHAFPFDELKPLSCKPRHWNNRDRGGVDDILGGYALNLVDSLDSLAVMGEVDRFWTNVKRAGETVTYDRDVSVSLFEATIRMLGGFTSAHMLALGPMRQYAEARNYEFYDHFAKETVHFKYNNELIERARELADILLPAFDTPTGMPFFAVNLQKGVDPDITGNIATSDVGTLLIEFTVLSRATGDPKYETAARRAMRALYMSRSKNDLFAISVDVRTGEFTSRLSGIGPGVDSLLEYQLKSYFLFGDAESWDQFEVSYEAVKAHTTFGPWQLEVDVDHGIDNPPLNYYATSLGAFFIGVQSLVGDFRQATAMYSQYMNIWLQFHSLPEAYDVVSNEISDKQKRNPLRPEFIEATYYLYQGTRDPFYLRAGRRMLYALQNISRVDCGYAGLGDVQNRLALEDRMDTYFFAETLKYMYMLFDLGVKDLFAAEQQQSVDDCPVGTFVPEGWLAWPNVTEETVTFSTEGHIFLLGTPEYLERHPNPEFITHPTTKQELYWAARDIADIKATCPAVIKRSKQLNEDAAEEEEEDEDEDE